MNASTPEGILGSIVVVLLTLSIYFIVTKKVALKLPSIPSAKVAIALFGLVLVGLAVWGLSGSGTWSWSPTPSGVWQFFRDYWFWIVLILAGLYFLFDGMTHAPAWSKGAKGMVVAFAVLMVSAMAVHGIWGESSPSPKTTRSEIPLASSPQSEWKKLVIPAGGKSELVPLPVGMVVKMNGNRFRLVNVYQDGRECSFGDNCPVGPPTRGVYALNEANEMNIVSYAYAPN